MLAGEYFSTPMWFEEKFDFVNSLTNNTDKYINDVKKEFKKKNDFGIIYDSNLLVKDNKFIDFKKYIKEKSFKFLDWQGFDVEKYELIFSEFGVCEFSKKGGGYLSVKINPNQHVSGFYFLKASDKTSFPIFHDPREGAKMTKLIQKNKDNVTSATDAVHFKAKPGSLMIFPSYIPHEFSMDDGKEQFRFVYWSIKTLPKK
jgi:hypothetical protein